MFHDTSCGLTAAVAIHSTVHGPALGGTLMWSYLCEEEAIEDFFASGPGNELHVCSGGAACWWGKRFDYRRSPSVINAGGLVFIAMQRQGITAEKEIKAEVNRIEGRLKQLFKRARDEKILPDEVADLIAAERLQR